MSITDEQVKKLRKLAKDYSDWGIGIKRTDRVLRQAADTIETLSKKLVAVNEQSLRCHRYVESLETKINDMKLQIKGNETEKKLIQEMAEEIENLYGRETDLTEWARDYLECIECLEEDCGSWIYCGDGKIF